MRRLSFTLVLTVLSLYFSYAQCGLTQAIEYLHGNEIRATVTSGGDLFWDGDDGHFSILTAEGAPTTIFTQGLWLGAKRADGQIVASAETYGRSYGEQSYFQGPGSAEAVTPEFCQGWDRVWMVRRHDIEAHLSDYADNGQVDEPIAAIFEWPGRGNPHFEARLGFRLPDGDAGLAPFVDTDGDGVYDPMAGDYPAVESMAVLPEVISWSLFNDFRGNDINFLNPYALGVDVHRTVWAMRCEGGNPLNRTVFVSYKVVNRSGQPLDSLVLGTWHDFDLGCYTDDYIGSAPAQNAFFAYNREPQDQNPCPQGIAPFVDEAPVQAVAVLNKPLSAFTYYVPDWVATEIGLIAPRNTAEYFESLNGRFADGTPLTASGNGYQSSGAPTTFAFHGDPNDPEQWSLMSEELEDNFDLNVLGSVHLGQLEPGQSATVELAYLFVQEPGLDHLENVTAMYGQLDWLHAGYENGFGEACQLPERCTEDCVWPGDANADGIANHEDVLAVGLAFGSSGSSREGFTNWAPYLAEPWSSPGTKHADANGDGSVNAQDLLTTQLNYNLTNSTYEERWEYTPGPELVIESPSPNANLGITEGKQLLLRVVLVEEVPGLKGLAFSMEYDPRFFQRVNLFSLPTAELHILHDDDQGAQVDFAQYVVEADSFLVPSRLVFFSIKAKEQFDIPVPSDTSYLRIKNIVAIRADGSRIPIGSTDLLVTFEGVTISSSEEQEAAPAMELKLFPNPSTGLLTADFPGQRVDRLRLFSATGQLLRLWEGPFISQQSLDLRGLPAGLYFLRAEQGDRVLTEKVVLK